MTQAFRRSPRDRRRPPRRPVPLSRPAREGDERGARIPARAANVEVIDEHGDDSALPRIHEAGLFAGASAATALSTIGCARASATTWSSSKTPTAFRRSCPTSISICSAKAPICSSTTSSARIRCARRRRRRGLRGVRAERAARQRGRRFQLLGRPPPRHAGARQRLLGDLRPRRARRRQIQVRDHRPRRPACCR